MEQTSKIESYIQEIAKYTWNHPSKKHDEDHKDIWVVLRLILSVLWEVEAIRQQQEKIDNDIYGNINNIGNAIRSAGHSLGIQAQSIEQLQRVANVTLDKLPKITTMQKGALITNGENVIDTIQIESWRYLLVKNITPSDWNEYAKLDKLFSWEIVEVTDWKYDVKVDLGTNTEGETATMTVNIDLLFVKY